MIPYFHHPEETAVCQTVCPNGFSKRQHVSGSDSVPRRCLSSWESPHPNLFWKFSANTGFQTRGELGGAEILLLLCSMGLRGFTQGAQSSNSCHCSKDFWFMWTCRACVPFASYALTAMLQGNYLFSMCFHYCKYCFGLTRYDFFLTSGILLTFNVYNLKIRSYTAIYYETYEPYIIMDNHVVFFK